MELFTPGDPQILHTGDSFADSSSMGVEIRLKRSVNGNVDCFWSRSGADGYAATKKVGASYSGSGECQTLFFELAGHTEWDGQTITRLPIDPPGDGLINTEDPDDDNGGVSDAWESAMNNWAGRVCFDFETAGDL